MKGQGVSAVIAAKNEEKNIKRCLESVKWTDEVILVDSNSKDRTIEIAKSCRPDVKIYQFMKKNYLIEEKKNFGIKKATKSWVMILDADEEATKKLAQEIAGELRNPGFDAYTVRFKHYSFGRFLKGNFWKDMRITRLFRNGKAIYKKLEPHKLISVKGKVGNLNGYINHYVYANTREFIAKTERYTSQAAPFIARNMKGGLLSRPLKINLYSRFVEPVLFAGWVFSIKKMYKDHFIGAWISILMGYYLYLERKKANLLKKKGIGN